ncbi:MAG TPA: PepSY domain-containing protein [Armatimonadota bacterium]|jgi:hypothetical protein
MTKCSKRSVFAIFGTLVITLALAGMSQAATIRKVQKPAVSHTQITAAQAEAAALHKFPGKVVEKTKLENEEGVWQYGVMVKSGKTLREIMVNAKSGKIDSAEVTTASKEGIEAKADAAQEKAQIKNHKQAKAKSPKAKGAK